MMNLETLYNNPPSIYQFACFNWMKEKLDESVIEKESKKMHNGRNIPRVTRDEAEKFIKYMSFKYNLQFNRFK